MSKLKFLSAAIAAISIFATALSANEPIETRFNGSVQDIGAQLIGETTYVNLDSVQNLLGNISGASLDVEAMGGENYISARGRYVGGAEILEIDGDIFVPIRSIAKMYNADVYWDDPTRSVDVTLEASDGILSGDEYYNADELYWMSRIISAEAQGEPMAGKILVGNVVLNRMKSDEFPDTIYGVIFDNEYGVQFTPTANGTVYNEPTEESIIAAKICLDGYYISRDAMYFLNPRIATSFWIVENRPFLFSVGGHDFYS
ncbi:MAG: copper amine oxidase [Clostridiales bacterium]|nr:copper amine oxidase [Clostridiales bacterium]